MAQIGYRANLISGHFPFLTRQHGRTIVVGNKDHAFNQPLIASNANEDKDKGIPQVYYGHNIMPTNEGIQSVGYINAIPTDVTTKPFLDIFHMRDINENKGLFCPAIGATYVFDSIGTNTWVEALDPNYLSSSLVTVAYVNGHTYVYLGKIGCFEYDFATDTWNPITLTGLTPTLINGIISSNGFLIAWDDFTIYRSQAVAPTDFTPDPSLGSGSAIPEEIRGKIVVCYPITGGFLIYTTQNIVAASFSQNIRFPFNYREVKNSAGIASHRHVAWQQNSGDHYAWTLAGLQKIDKAQAQIVFADVSDFLTSRLFEDYDTVTYTLSETQLTGQRMRVRLAFCGKRFLVVSYGTLVEGNFTTEPFTHALIHDFAYKRWGKVKIPHVAAFEFLNPAISGDFPWTEFGTDEWDDINGASGPLSWSELTGLSDVGEYPLELIAFLGLHGKVDLLSMNDIQTNNQGVLILGKYQYVRERRVSLQEINVECSNQGNDFELRIFSSDDGKNIARTTVAYKNKDTGQFKQYLATVEGLNHSLVFEKTFNLNCIDIKFKVEGKI